MSARDRTRGASGTKLTYDEFVLLPDDGQRHELIDGEHCVTPSADTKHQRVSGTLYGLIWNYLQVEPIGEVFHAPYDVVFSNFDVVEPDLVFVSRSRARVITERHVRGAPDLVVEIGSPSTRSRDETLKRFLYERFGVQEYWFVDPETNVIRVYLREGEFFAQPLELSTDRNDALTTSLLPGLALPLRRVFAG